MARLRTVALFVCLGASSACAARSGPASSAAPVEDAAIDPPERALEIRVPPPVSQVEVEVEGYTPEIATILGARTVSYHHAETRIALARRGPVRLHPEGEAYGLVDHAAFASAKPIQVVDDLELPRVVTDDGAIRLLLHVERSDAQPVVISPAPLRQHPDRSYGSAPRRGHVVLRPGAWVEVGAQRGGMVRVTYRGDADILLRGWIPASVLGTTAKPREPEPVESFAAAYVTRRETTLTTVPGGNTLVTIDGEHTVVAFTKRIERGQRLVQYESPCSSDLAYVGFVPARDLFQPNYGFALGCGYRSTQLPVWWGEAQDAPRVHLDPGRFLLAPDRPLVVGCVIERTEVADLGDGLHAVATLWGPVEVRLAPVDFMGPCGTER